MRYAHLGPSALRGAMDVFDGFTKRHDFAPSEFGHQVGTTPPTEAFGAPELLSELSQFAAYSSGRASETRTQRRSVALFTETSRDGSTQGKIEASEW